MNVATKRKISKDPPIKVNADLSAFVPPTLRDLGDPQTAIPRLAKDGEAVRLIEQAIQTIPTVHRLYLGDARDMLNVKPAGGHLVLTSPPSWTLKRYRDSHAHLVQI